MRVYKQLEIQSYIELWRLGKIDADRFRGCHELSGLALLGVWRWGDPRWVGLRP